MLLEKEIKFKDYNFEKILLCPYCECNCLHHDIVIVFNRNEDAETTQVTTTINGKSKIELLPSEICGNPSYRRDGLIIDFLCEKCEKHSELAIYQHKGQTFIKWKLDEVNK